MGGAGTVFVLIFGAIMLIPCAAVAWLGYHAIAKIGQYPSKTPAIQMGVLLKLVVIEVVSFTLILAFFKILVSQ